MAKRVRKGSVDMHTDQPPAQEQQPVKPNIKSNLDIKVKLEKTPAGRLMVTVKLLQGEEVISEDYDFVQVD